MVFNWREARKVSKSLTVQYDKVLYLIEDSEFSRRAIGKYIDVWHYPDGHKELRLNGVSLPYSTYDKLSEIGNGEHPHPAAKSPHLIDRVKRL